jgi:hypothetical protein
VADKTTIGNKASFGFLLAVGCWEWFYQDGNKGRLVGKKP